MKIFFYILFWKPYHFAFFIEISNLLELISVYVVRRDQTLIQCTISTGKRQPMGSGASLLAPERPSLFLTGPPLSWKTKL